MDIKNFEKKLGFAAPPAYPISGSFAVYTRVIEAEMKCHGCGHTILVRVKGDTSRLDEKGATRAVVAAVRKKHDCPAVRDTLVAKAHKFFSDFRRGKEKKGEVDYLKEKAGIDTKDAPISKAQIEESRKTDEVKTSPSTPPKKTIWTSGGRA